MDINKVISVLESSDQDAIEALLADKDLVFWIDWREEDDAIPDACESILQTGSLSGELVEDDSEEGYTVYVRYGDRRVQVPLTYSEADRHITLLTLNQVLAPDYEVRFCIDSHGADTLAFVPLSCQQWAQLEQRYGEVVGRRFFKISERPNLFTDRLSF